MKNNLLLFGILICTGSYEALSGEINVALGKSISIQYTGSLPTQPKYADPTGLVDGDLTTYIHIDPKSSGMDNAGTFVTISLGNSFSLARFRMRQAFDIKNANTRMYGYQILTSNDSLSWDMAVDVPNNTAAAPDTALPSAVTARFVRLVITKVAESAYQTFLAEIEIYADITCPAITSVAVAATSTRGQDHRDVSWTSMNMVATDLVDVSFRATNGSDAFAPAASAIPNNGLFSWRTDTLADGGYTVKVSPAAAGQSLSGTAAAVIANFAGLRLSADKGYHFSYSGSTNRPSYDWIFPLTYAPPFYSGFMQDTIRMIWNFSVRQTGMISYSTDSMETWIPITTITDTAQRSYSLPCPVLERSNLNTFFRISMMRFGKLMASAVSVQNIVGALPKDVILRWSRLDTAYRPYGMPALLSYEQAGHSYLLLGERWIVDGHGDTLSGYGRRRSWESLGYAAGNIDSSGEPKLVTFGRSSINVASPASSVPLASLAVNYDNMNSLHLVDIDGDQEKEIIADDYGQGISFFKTGGNAPHPLQNMFSHSAITDFDGDGQLEVAFILTATNELALCSLDGAMKKGFPVKMYDALRTWILSENLNGDGKYQIIFAGSRHLYALNADGSMQPGFPVFINAAMDNTYPAVADINSDGKLEIVLTAQSGYPFTTSNAAAPVSLLYAVGADGAILPHWPASASGNYKFPYTITNTTTGVTESIPMVKYGFFSSPLIASIDGDSKPEIIVTSGNGFLYAFSSEGVLREGYPIYLACTGGEKSPSGKSNNSVETGVLGDFDNDGSLNFVIHSYPDTIETHGRVICLDFGPGSYNAKATPWPMLLQNPERTGIAPKPVDGSTLPDAVIIAAENAPNVFSLSQNYPNPFNPTTTIAFSIKERCAVRFTVFDVVGRVVADVVDGMKDPGYYMTGFDASQLSSGIYLYKLQAGNFVGVKKMVVQK